MDHIPRALTVFVFAAHIREIVRPLVIGLVVPGDVGSFSNFQRYLERNLPPFVCIPSLSMDIVL